MKQLLGIDLPLIQAPMAGVQGSALAAAVSAAGGLGSLPAAMLSPDALAQELGVLESAGTAYNVNFFAHAAPVPNPARERAWLEALAPYRDEYGVVETSGGPGRRAFDDESLDVLRRFHPAMVSFHFGLPEQRLLTAVKSLGAMIASTAATVDEARWLREQGADLIIAQGWEAGGHRGHFLSDDLSLHRPTLELVAGIRAAVDLPVVAAGGITTADDVQAALAAGARAAQCGTAFLLAEEATTSRLQRAAIEAPHGTVVTTALTGRPARGIPNRLISELGAFPDAVPEFPLAAGALAPLRAAAEAQGRTDFTTLWCGDSVDGVVAAPAAEIVARLLS